MPNACYNKAAELGRIESEVPSVDKKYGLAKEKSFANEYHSEEGKGLMGLRCYSPCRDGYAGKGPVCFSICPPGFRDDGAMCTKPDGHKRTTQKVECEKGFHLTMANSYCTADCPKMMSDIGLSCIKDTYVRGIGSALGCKDGFHKSMGQCYKQCDRGYTGTGPICFGICPTGMKTCGPLLCITSDSSCFGKVIGMLRNVVSGALKLASVTVGHVGAVNA